MININAYNGYEIDGVTAGDASGSAVAVGDVNDDNIGDIIIGAPNASPGGTSNAGSTYVVFGSSTTPGVAFSLSSINGTNGFELDGATANEHSGSAVAAGDVNDDNKMDVVVGAPGSGRGGAAGSGSTYVYFGEQMTTAWTNPYALSGL